jgi:hypothetical protein
MSVIGYLYSIIYNIYIYKFIIIISFNFYLVDSSTVFIF